MILLDPDTIFDAELFCLNQNIAHQLLVCLITAAANHDKGGILRDVWVFEYSLPNLHLLLMILLGTELSKRKKNIAARFWGNDQPTVEGNLFELVNTAGRVTKILVKIYLHCSQCCARIPERLAVVIRPRAVRGDLVCEAAANLVQHDQTAVVNELDLLANATRSGVVELLATLGHSLEHVLLHCRVVRVAVNLGGEQCLDERVGECDAVCVNEDVTWLEGESVIDSFH